MTRQTREALHEWSELIFAFAVPIIVTFITCWAIIPGVVAFFTRVPA